jgi:hypothetical protein
VVVPDNRPVAIRSAAHHAEASTSNWNDALAQISSRVRPDEMAER